MGRLLFMIFIALVAILVVMVINSYLTNKRANKNAMSKEEKRKNFDDDIKAVAKEIKKRQKV